MLGVRLQLKLESNVIRCATVLIVLLCLCLSASIDSRLAIQLNIENTNYNRANIVDQSTP